MTELEANRQKEREAVKPIIERTQADRLDLRQPYLGPHQPLVLRLWSGCRRIQSAGWTR